MMYKFNCPNCVLLNYLDDTDTPNTIVRCIDCGHCYKIAETQIYNEFDIDKIYEYEFQTAYVLVPKMKE